ncbi:GGDEF domain-containing protein [Kineobactrum salinum]|uniref:diguanylate cyclase n=1 Tax=Kineobactrum salinum TaxID=2708301 RepID=A0A6C0U2L2_9GAMM|nr:GGDEF domain-containing protein [Kineobactrum salinum]QIB66168.1 diguanylate cyclase [Kineobactrum salinum]
MIYQRHIPPEELFAAQLEMLMQNGRIATIAANLLGVLATVALFWQFMPLMWLLLWAGGVMVLLLVRSRYMSNALLEQRFRTHPRRVYWGLLLGSVVTGLVWSSAFIAAAPQTPASVHYVFLLLIFLVTILSMGVTLALREYFLAQLFAALWPIAWWCMVHYWDQPYNLLIGWVTLGICALLLLVSNRVYLSIRNLIAVTWEREAMARDLGNLTVSLRDRNRQLRDARRQLTDLANVDELTGLGNRRLVNRVLQEEVNRSRRSGTELAIIMLDVDYFKSYNDNQGHLAGDRVLQQLADVMQRAVNRAGEVAARYGGEEFILILPGLDQDAALDIAGRLRELVELARIPHGDSPVSPYITVSQGIATMQSGSQSLPSDLVRRADQALYRAKAAGRNAIAVTSQ